MATDALTCVWLDSCVHLSFDQVVSLANYLFIADFN